MKTFLQLSAANLLLVAFLMSSCSEEQEAVPEVQLKSYESGTDDGFYWQLWTDTDDQGGYVDYQNGDDGNYSVSWDYDGNFTCGKGWSSGSTNRVIGYNVGTHNHNGGGVFGYYGWSRSPLMEYYVNEMWGSRPDNNQHVGTLTSDGATYDIYTNVRNNKPSIDGTQTFRQIISTRRGQASTGENHEITFANHVNAWQNEGYGLGSDMSPYGILLTEAYGGSSGNVNATVWEAGSSSGGNNGGGNNDGGNNDGGNNNGGSDIPIRLRARSTDGQGDINVIVGGNTIVSWTLGTGMADYEATIPSGDIRVEFTNDADGRDVQIDYLSVDGDYRQAEDQSYNTGVWQDGDCGGSNSEWLHCGGSIGFGDTP